MNEYTSFKYIYPPRPAIKAPSTALKTYERMGFIAQPKLDGSYGVLFMQANFVKLMGRHNNLFARNILKESDLTSLYRGPGFTVLTGEYMNKSQRDVKGKPFNGFVIFDILVYNGKHLIQSTFKERQELLDTLYPDYHDNDQFTVSLGNNMYRAKNFNEGFDELWKEAVKIEMYEGFVLKRPDGILENGIREANNTGWQLKIRKPTKNYSF